MYMLRPFCKIGPFAKCLAIMQRDQIHGQFTKGPIFLAILQKDENFGLFAKWPVLSLVNLQNA